MKDEDMRKIANPSKSPIFVAKPEPKSDKKMNFGEAMQMIVKGSKITKVDWKNKNWIAYLHKDLTVTLKDPNGADHSWIISEGDIVGKDYIEV